MSGIRINEISRDSALDGRTDLVHVYKLVGGQFKSVAAPLSAVAFEGPRGSDGTPGVPGIDGNNGNSIAQLVCYRRFDPSTSSADILATQPGTGTNDDGSFDFGTREFVPPTGWSVAPPPVTPSTSDHILYQSNGVAFTEGTTGIDTNIQWSAPEAGGIDGRPGTDGKSTFQAQVYTRAATNPGAPTGGSFNFGSDELLPPLSGDNVTNGGSILDVQNPNNNNTHNWYVDVAGPLGPPETDDPVWVCVYQFGAVGDTGTDTATTWSVPTRFTGTDGADGYSTYFGIIYKRTNVNISGDRPGDGTGDPATNGYYDFRANQFVFSPSLTGIGGEMEGWSEIPPPDVKTLGQTTALWSSTTVATARSNFLGSDPVIDDSLTWTYPVTAVQPVVDGNRGDAVTQVRAYIRSVGGTPSVTTLENASVFFNFQDKILDLGTSGWYNEPYKSQLSEGDVGYGSDALYVSVGTARSTFNGSVYPNDTDIEWSTPVQSSESGEDAISTYLAQCYTRYTGTTVLSDYPPTGGSYSFTNNLLTTPTDGSGEGLTWYVNIPPGTGQIYVTQQQFAIRGNQGSRDGGSNWSPPAVLAYDGQAGFSGATNAGISLYYGSDTELTGGNIPDFPDDVTVSVDLDPSSNSFGFLTKSTTNGQDASITSNQVLSSNSAGVTEGTGWYTRIPSNDWIYITQAVAADSNTSDSNYIDTIAGTEWSDTVAFRKPGSNGLAGLGTSIVSLYKRTGTTAIPNPAEPSGPVKYYLGSGDGQLRGDIISIDGTNFNGWTKDPPSFTNSNDHYLWQINATASSRLCADKIFANEWSTPRIFSQNPFDLTETTVSHTVQAYIRSSVLPTTDPGSCTVALSGENAGQITSSLSNSWSTEIPDGDQQVYIVHATAAGSVTTITDTDTVEANEWSSPAKWGIVGEQGEQGIAGNVAKIITLYKRTVRNPNPAVVVPALDGNYDFNADTFTFEAPDDETWTLEIPAKQVNDKKLWQTFATALCSQDSSVYSISTTDWSTPKAVLEDGVTITPVFSSNFDGVSASLDSVFLSSGQFKDHTHINFSDEYESINSSQVLTKTNGDTVAANTLTFTKIKGEIGPVGDDGNSTIAIFSDVENPTIGTDDLSYFQVTGAVERNFVAFVEFGPTQTYQSKAGLDLTNNSNQTFITSLDFVNIKGQQGVSVSSITRSSEGLVTVNYDDGSTPDTFTVSDGADVSVTDVSRHPTTGVVTMSFSNGGDQTFTVADGVGIGSVTSIKSGTTTTVVIKDDNDVTLRQFDIEDGLPGAKGRVLVAYAEDADGTNPSTTIGSREFVKYHEYEGDTAPNISDFAADTGTLSGGFVQFIGPQGITNSIFPIYADDASGTNATVDASTNKPFVTFVESSTPITNSNIPSGQTYVKYLGSDGTSVTIQGSKDDQSELNALISSATTGDSYIGTGNGDLTEGNLYVFDGSTFNNVGTIQGPTGNTGKNATPVYATSSGGASASLTPAAGKTFIAFVNFTNANPQDSDIPGGLTYTNFKGTSISSVEKTGTTVTVNYDDGSTPDTFTVNDGADVSVTDVSRVDDVVTMSFSNGADQTFNLADGVGIGSVTTSKTGSTTTIRIENDNGVLLKEFDIADGLPGAKGRVLVVYADDASGANASTTIGTRTFVKYFEYEGDDTPSATTAASGGGFVQFIGPEGPTGDSITPIYATNATGSGATLTQTATTTFVNFFEGKVDTIDGSTLKFNNQNVGSLPSTFVNLKGQTGEEGPQGPVGSVPIFASAADGTNASLTQSDSLPYVFFYTGGDVASDTDTDDLQLLGTSTSWKKITGDSLYTHIKYADGVLTSSDSPSDMTDDPTDKKYIGISLNNTSATESDDPGKYTWSLIRGNPGLPDGCQAVWGYNNSDGPSSITYLEDENVLQLQATNNDTTIGMVYPAVDVTDGRTVQFTVSYKTPDAADNNGVYLRIYEATTDLAEGKDRVGFLSVGSGSTTEIDNSPLIQASNRQHFWENGSASSSQGGPGITVTPSSADLENGPVSNEYKTVTITFEPDASSKYISLTILNWSDMDNKRLWVKPIRTTIVGDKGDKGTNSITKRLAEIFYKQSLTLLAPTVTRQLFVFDNRSIIKSNPEPQYSYQDAPLLDSQGSQHPENTYSTLRIWSRGFGGGDIAHSYSYDETTNVIKISSSRSTGTGRFGSYFRIRFLKPGQKYRLSGQFRIVDNGPGAEAVIDFSDRSTTPPADGSGLGGARTSSTTFQPFSVTVTADHGLLSDTAAHYFVDINVFASDSNTQGSISGEYKDLLLEEIADDSINENTTYDISTGDLSNVPSGWSTVPPNAESGKKIYRATAIVSYDADLETDTDAEVLIPDSDWSDARAWSDGGNRTAPQVSRVATYEYLDSSYESVDNSQDPIKSFYSFRKEGVMSVEDDNDNDSVNETSGDVNTGYGTNIATSTDSIDSIGQILFNKKGKDDVDYSDFWRNLSTTSEFIWKYGSSWISFQRTGPIDLGGKWTGVRVNVLDHSDDLEVIGDLPGHFKPYDISTKDPDVTKAAEVVFGYTPTIIKQTVYLHKRTNTLLSPGDVAEDLVYNFTTGSITGNTASWSLEPPASTGSNKYLWRIQATATAKLDLTTGQYTDTILASEWSAPSIFAQDGSEGDAGSSYFQKYLYTRTTVSNPNLKTNWSADYKPRNMGITINDVGGDSVGRIRGTDIDATGDNALVSTGTGENQITWYEDIPDESLGQFLWVIVAPVAGSASDGNYVNILATSWAEPVLLSKDGVGLNSSTVRLYRRTTGATPAGGGVAGVNSLGFSLTTGTGTPAFTYTFDTGNLQIPSNVSTNEWSQSVDVGSGGTLWVSRAVASSAGTQDQIEWSQWSAPEKLVTDGTALILIDETFTSNNDNGEGARNQYINFIDDEYGDGSTNSGIPPVNSYHIEVVDGVSRSYLYTGGQNGTDKNDGNNFRQLTIDGAPGQAGTSFEFKGTVDNVTNITNKAIGDVYRITGENFNTLGDPRTSGLPALLVWKGNAWALLTSDGSDGPAGTDGASSKVFITYNTNVPTNTPNVPPNTSNGDYTAGNDNWSTTPTEASNWMSQKVAENATDNIAWSAPILITGEQGTPGTSTFNLKIFRRSETPPGQPTGGAYDFENKKFLPPTGWSSTTQNAGKGAQDGATAPTARPEDEIAYEWVLDPIDGNPEDSETWDISLIDNQAVASYPLWSSKATVSVGATSPDQIDSSITWSSPVIETLNGFDFDDDSIDPDAIFGVVQGNGVLKIIARDRYEQPLTDAAYAALGDPNSANRTTYGWLTEDTIDEQTLYIIR